MTHLLRDCEVREVAGCGNKVGSGEGRILEWQVWEIAEGGDIDLQEDSPSVFITVPRTAPALPQDLLMIKHRSRFSFFFLNFLFYIGV